MTTRNQLTLATAQLIRTPAFAATQAPARQPATGGGVDTVTPCVVESMHSAQYRSAQVCQNAPLKWDSLLPTPKAERLDANLRHGDDVHPIVPAVRGCTHREGRQPERPQNVGVLRSDTWEDARRKRATERGYAYVAPQVNSEIPNLLSSIHRTAGGQESAVIPLIDPELFRISISRREYSEHRLWAYAIQFSAGSGKILKSELYETSLAHNLIASRRTFDDIIQRGRGLYWRERGTYIYLTGWRKLAAKLTKWEAKHHPDRVATNLPGMRRVRVDLRCTSQVGHARVFNAWIAVKAQRNGYLDISRFVLTRLWGRTTKTLLQWQQLAGIRVEERYTEHHDIHNPLIPAHANLCLEKGGSEYASWRLSNRYIPAPIHIHEHNGQRRKVRKACHVAVDKFTPPVSRAGGLRRVQRIGRINFTDKSGKRGLITAHKQLNRHLKKHHDILDRPHYAFLIRRYGKHIYEMSDGTPVRRATAERDRAGEKDAAFIERRALYRQGWIYRVGSKAL